MYFKTEINLVNHLYIESGLQNQIPLKISFKNTQFFNSYRIKSLSLVQYGRKLGWTQVIPRKSRLM
jgi:hypothetical protein